MNKTLEQRRDQRVGLVAEVDKEKYIAAYNDGVLDVQSIGQDHEQQWKVIDEIVQKFIEWHLSGQDKREWLDVRDEVKDALRKFKTPNDFFNNLIRRTDLSDDQKWMMEEKQSFIETAFLLRDSLK